MPGGRPAQGRVHTRPQLIRWDSPPELQGVRGEPAMTWSVGNRSAWATALVVSLVVIMLGALGPSTAPATAAAAASGGLFTSLPPTRLLDTRSGVGAPVAEVGPGATLHLQVGGRGGV